ncbi:MAG: pseudouridine-5'-phosphate glycosidase [Chloroflexi bacterium]|nr:pseudouridine-5'-phosphate glycosidase [Chloroflexota bacterium]
MPTRFPIQVPADLLAAIAAGRGVVALESTVIAHGLPRPENLTTARRLEAVVRAEGGLPATVAILGGRLHAGLTDAQLQHLANDDGIRKVSRRDLPVAVARGQDGATTVATTMWIAARAGISVFATGGIGGVHRGHLPDISADLPELARIPMVVVCSGAKIILDLPATREWLETYGVTVVGYQCDEFPAFYSRRSGLPVDVRADKPEDVVAILRARRALDMHGAVLVTVPVPPEAEIPMEQLQGPLDRALAEAEQQNITGRALTPFLLSRLAEFSDGATLRANIALLDNNARTAAQIARAMEPRMAPMGFPR